MLSTNWLGENVRSSLPSVHIISCNVNYSAVNPCGNCPKIGNLQNYLLGSHSKGFIIWSRKTTSNYIFLFWRFSFSIDEMCMAKCTVFKNI